MRQKLIVLAVAVVLLSSCATVYKAENLKEIKSEHKTLAIMPVMMSLDPLNVSEDQPLEELKAMQKEEAIYLQNFAYALLKKREIRQRLPLEVKNILETNQAILETDFNIYDFTYDDPSDLLDKVNTDLVLSCMFYRSMPQVGAYKFSNQVGGKFALYNKEGDLLWEMFVDKSGHPEKVALKLSKKEIKKMKRRMPYRINIFKSIVLRIQK